MIHFPPREVRAGNFPFLTFPIGGKNECALLRADEDSYVTHGCLVKRFGFPTMNKEILTRNGDHPANAEAIGEHSEAG